ncbi:MAG: hypothetical protein KDE33_01690 [Bacteroidetes bacterium]|nr:hypothetical protein [Bacteroidota bacterium]
MNYKVLWIDDDCHTTGKDFIGQAEQDDVDIIAFESHEEGMLYLEQNIDEIHAVILDAKVKFKKSDTVTGLDGLKASRDKLIELNNKLDLPFFIFTGQPDYQSNEIFKQSFGEFYVKGEDDDRIIKDIISRVEQKEEYILQKKYKDVLSTCSDNFLGKKNYSRLLELVKHIEKNDKIKGGEDKLTSVRKIVEALFYSLGKLEIIPSELIGAKGWINGSSIFLAGKHNDYVLEEEVVSPIITFNIHKLLDIIQDGSHAYGDLKYEVDSYIKNCKSDYFFRSCVFLLFDLILWFNEFVSNNQDIDANKAKWNCKAIEGEWMSGRITRIAENGWGTLLPNSSIKTISIPPKMVEDNNLKEGDTISVITELNGTKTHIKEIKI